jgi:DNA-directed RNA polymerase specialized sigma subunit
MPMRKLSNEQNIELYNAGELSLREIGERAGLSGEMVRQVAKRAGAPKRKTNPFKRPPREIPKDVLERMYSEERLPISRIAKELSTSEITVHRELRRHGIKIRPHGSEPRR